MTQDYKNEDIPCRFCGSPAVGIYYLDKGCFCYPDDLTQALCEQHIEKATPIGEMTLTGKLDASEPRRWLLVTATYDAPTAGREHP